MEECAVSTGVKTIAAQAFTRRGRLHTVILTPAAAAATLTVYDGVGANNAIAVLSAQTNGSTTFIEFTAPVEISTGLYFAVTGVGAQYTATYTLS